jgi:hypothetical protein
VSEPWFERGEDGALLIAANVEKISRRHGYHYWAKRWLPVPLALTPLRSRPVRPISRRRISLALDSRGMDGPEVDEALGVTEPTVDEWESGALIPSIEDVQRLATLTGYPVEFFYREDPVEIDRGWMCGDDGCELVEFGGES